MKKRRSGPKPRKSKPPSVKQGRRVIAASEFKAQCLRILDEVAEGQEVLVTKHGEEIARVVPVGARTGRTSRGALKGMGEVTGDIVHTDWSADFDVLK